MTHLEEPKIVRPYGTKSGCTLEASNAKHMAAAAFATCMDGLNKNGANVICFVEIISNGKQEFVDIGFIARSFEHAADLASCWRILMYGCSENDFLRYMFVEGGEDAMDWHPYGNALQALIGELEQETNRRKIKLL